jgi:hypothetical protein
MEKEFLSLGPNLAHRYDPANLAAHIATWAEMPQRARYLAQPGDNGCSDSPRRFSRSPAGKQLARDDER